MPVTKRKVLAYITHGDRLLIFSHPYEPQAGIQVPAGTVEDGEDPDDAVMREAFEETGLIDLRLVGFLGEQMLDRADVGLDEVHHRRFYHLQCDELPPERWRHAELDPSDGTPGPIVFELFWARIPDEIPPLIADHGVLLPRLFETLQHQTDAETLHPF